MLLRLLKQLERCWEFGVPGCFWVCRIASGKPDLDLDVGTVQHFHPVTGDNMTIRGYASELLLEFACGIQVFKFHEQAPHSPAYHGN